MGIGSNSFLYHTKVSNHVTNLNCLQHTCLSQRENTLSQPLNAFCERFEFKQINRLCKFKIQNGKGRQFILTSELQTASIIYTDNILKCKRNEKYYSNKIKMVKIGKTAKSM